MLSLPALLLFLAAPEPKAYRYRPPRRPAPSLEAMLAQVQPGHDAFPEEEVARRIAERLDELAARLREGPDRSQGVGELLLAPEFRGGRLVPAREVSLGAGPALEVYRGEAVAAGFPHDRASFGLELGALLSVFRTIRTAEFLVTAIDVKGGDPARARTDVRYDIVGAGVRAWRAQRVGHWRLQWVHGPDDVWRVAEWTSLGDRRSQASGPVFTEVTAAALGGNAAFRRQLAFGLDAWSTALDAVFSVGGMGHHGVSAGDADGDGLDDLYVSQPSGLPNRLFLNRGGRFEDATEAAGLAVLDGTSESLFADVDNDGDQDLVLVTGAGLLLFLNDGKGHFTRKPDAFRFKDGLRGSPTSVAMADYDRDGFLDIYVCTYSYVIGTSEDKAGTPTPYHDARNGPPDALLRNDGRGSFVEVTAEAGLAEDNDRFGFAAAWADYDEDGWPDLLVANDFGRKNLYHNEGMKDGKVTFKDVAAAAGVEDFGAGMSAAWLDYDADGHLDAYTGNMWTAAGQRVTAEPGFMPAAPPEVRDLYRRHARGNSLFRNRGDGSFEDVSLKAGAEMGRWAWSSDALDFDGDGGEDLYVVNGMFTRDPGEADVDLESFFWRQVVARSPLTRVMGTPFDDAWRATNRLLMAEGSQARHERNVLLRNDGRGGFDDVSGSAGLDLDQDGRSFTVLDYDGDGDPDVVAMAPRSAPQLRVFRNDFAGGHASLAVRLTGTKSNRDAVGARVTVETDIFRRTKVVQAGSGFISERSKELLFGLGQSRRVVRLTVRWPSGLDQTFSGIDLNQRVRLQEGSAAFGHDPLAKRSAPSAADAAILAAEPAEGVPTGTWLYQPFPAPAFAMPALDGSETSLSAWRGRPALLLFWSTSAPPSVKALEDLARQRGALSAAGASVLAVAVDAPGPGNDDDARVRAAAGSLGIPVAIASADIARTYAILSRFMFDRREDLRLPTALLLDGQGNVVKVYRDRFDAARMAADAAKIDASPAERLARALPFPGTFYSSPAERNEFPYALDLAEQGFVDAALAAFQRAAERDPSAITFYNLGTLSLRNGRPAEARPAFERALALRPDYPEAQNSLGALLAQNGDVPGAIVRFRAALEARPDFPDALNNLGYALFQTGQEDEAYKLYERALALQPDFPEAYNNLGIFFGRRGDLERAESQFRQAVEKRPGYGEAANNLALVLAARGDGAAAVATLQHLLEANPGFEMAYVSLAKLYLGAGRQREAVQVLELLLQRSPRNPLGLDLLRQLRPGG